MRTIHNALGEHFHLRNFCESIALSGIFHNIGIFSTLLSVFQINSSKLAIQRARTIFLILGSFANGIYDFAIYQT